jgi:hypothetical protein
VASQGDIISIADTGTPKPIDFQSFFLFLRSLRPPTPALGCALWGHFPPSLLAPSRLPPRFSLGVQGRRRVKKRVANVRPSSSALSRIRIWSRKASFFSNLGAETSKTIKNH